jgi:GH15 family glucan-1,4-alpha-glucosidase
MYFIPSNICRYSIHGETDLEEKELNHLDGYRGSKPVRIGNGAANHLQLDIYGGSDLLNLSD